MGAVTVEQFLASEWPMSLDPDFDGACPCSTVRGEGFKVQTHCWRTSHIEPDGSKCNCPFSGVHVSGEIDEVTARRIAEHMRDNNGWSNPDWNIGIKVGTR